MFIIKESIKEKYLNILKLKAIPMFEEFIKQLEKDEKILNKKKNDNGKIPTTVWQNHKWNFNEFAFKLNKGPIISAVKELAKEKIIPIYFVNKEIHKINDSCKSLLGGIEPMINEVEAYLTFIKNVVEKIEKLK